MGNKETRAKRDNTLSDNDVTELSNLSGFTPSQVREWHAGFIVSKLVSSELLLGPEQFSSFSL